MAGGRVGAGVGLAFGEAVMNGAGVVTEEEDDGGVDWAGVGSGLVGWAEGAEGRSTTVGPGDDDAEGDGEGAGVGNGTGVSVVGLGWIDGL